MLLLPSSSFSSLSSVVVMIQFVAITKTKRISSFKKERNEMARKKCVKVTRSVFLLLNVLIFLSGIALIALGTITLTSGWSFLHLLQFITNGDAVDNLEYDNRNSDFNNNAAEKFHRSSTYMHNGCYMLICAGTLLLPLACAACFGTLLHKRALLGWYGTFILLVMILQLAASFYTAFHTPMRSAFYMLERSLSITLQRGYVGDERVQGRDRLGELNTATLAWNALMERLHCCGVNGSDDFVTSGIIQNRKYRVDGVVPKACCITTLSDDFINNSSIINTCPSHPTEQNSNMHIGCYRTFRAYLITTSQIMLVTTFSIAALLLTAIGMACVVFYLDSSGDEGHYYSASGTATASHSMEEMSLSQNLHDAVPTARQDGGRAVATYRYE